MKPIFLSLGSNYSFSFILFALSRFFYMKDRTAASQLEKKLSRLFDGETYLFYKGRDAIEFGLRSLDIGKGNTVLTQAFTCWAVEEGIRRSGAIPVFVDLEKKQLNPSIDKLEQAYRSNKNVRAVIIQHTLGYPADISSIRNWCNSKGIFLIEDLAQALGAKDSSGQMLGSLADVVVLSFGRDKIIDAVSGGACIIKAKVKNEKLKNIKIREHLPFLMSAKDLIYPLLTWIIRETYIIGLGKMIHAIATKTGLITSPIKSPLSALTLLPGSHAALALRQLSTLEAQLSHRRKIGRFYFERLKSLSSITDLDVESGANLRFPLRVNQTNEIVSCMNNKDIHLSDRWYRKPVDCGKFKNISSYKDGSCPNAEKLTGQIINLPTHKHVSLKEAGRIVIGVKKCISLR
jgi:dTDP-4-amino-4,6-dideoxygalactose transaminase